MNVSWVDGAPPTHWPSRYASSKNALGWCAETTMGRFFQFEECFDAHFGCLSASVNCSLSLHHNMAAPQRYHHRNPDAQIPYDRHWELKPPEGFLVFLEHDIKRLTALARAGRDDAAESRRLCEYLPVSFVAPSFSIGILVSVGSSILWLTIFGRAQWRLSRPCTISVRSGTKRWDLNVPSKKSIRRSEKT